MKNLLLMFSVLCLSLPVYSANIIAYSGKKEGAAEFVVINSTKIVRFSYDESDQILSVSANLGKSSIVWQFLVKTKKEATTIISRLLDENDLSFLELKFE